MRTARVGGRGKRRLARQHLEQHDAQRVHVAPAVHHGAAGLLGTHVMRRPDAEAGVRQPCAPAFARAMPKSATGAAPASRMFSGLMSRWTMPRLCAYASASATSWRCAAPPRAGSWPAVQPPPQRLALDVGHHVVEQAVGLAGVVQWQHVRMDSWRRSRSRGGSDRPHRAADLGVQHLDGHLAPVLAILREEDLRHAAAGDLRFHLVAFASSGAGARSVPPSGYPRADRTAHRAGRDGVW